MPSARLLHARFHKDSVSVGREGSAVPCAQKPTAVVRGPLQSCRSSTKHRLARARAATGRLLLGSSRSRLQRGPIAKQLAHWDQWPHFKLYQYLGHLKEAVLGDTGYFPLCRGGDSIVNPGPLEEQPALLTAEPHLQPAFTFQTTLAE